MALYAEPEIQQQQGVESVWFVQYTNATTSLKYTIDAQTGKILKKEKS